MNKQDLFTEFFKNKNYGNLKSLLKDSASCFEKEYLARIYFEEGDFKTASEIFKDAGMLYECGRCELLQGNLEQAKEIWSSIKTDSPPILWGRSLLEFINLYVINVPSFFQIRAFLEVDLDAMLKAGLLNYCENIVNGAHLLALNNQESYKFIGRVFINNNYYDLAELFLQKAKEVCYVDAEVHYLLAKYFIHNKDTAQAKKSLEIAIDKGFGYFPARKLLEEIKNKSLNI